MYCSYCGSHDHPYELCPKTWSGNAKKAWGLYCFRFLIKILI